MTPPISLSDSLAVPTESESVLGQKKESIVLQLLMARPKARPSSWGGQNICVWVQVWVRAVVSVRCGVCVPVTREGGGMEAQQDAHPVTLRTDSRRQLHPVGGAACLRSHQVSAGAR